MHVRTDRLQPDSVLDGVMADAARALPASGDFAFLARGSWQQAGRSAESIAALLGKHGMDPNKTFKAVLDRPSTGTAK